MFTIKVVSRLTGEPQEGIKVCASLRSLTDEIRTDTNGEAHFDNTPGKGKIFLNGKTVYEGDISSRVVLYV